MSKSQSGCIRRIWLLCLLKLCLFIKPTQFRQCHCQTFDMKVTILLRSMSLINRVTRHVNYNHCNRQNIFFLFLHVKIHVSSLCIYIQIKDFPLNYFFFLFCPKKSNWLVRVKFKHQIVIESPSCPKAYLFIYSVEQKKKIFWRRF